MRARGISHPSSRSQSNKHRFTPIILSNVAPYPKVAPPQIGISSRIHIHPKPTLRVRDSFALASSLHRCQPFLAALCKAVTSLPSLATHRSSSRAYLNRPLPAFENSSAAAAARSLLFRHIRRLIIRRYVLFFVPPRPTPFRPVEFPYPNQKRVLPPAPLHECRKDTPPSCEIDSINPFSGLDRQAFFPSVRSA